MRFTAVALLGLLTIVASSPVVQQKAKPVTVDKQYLQRQLDVLNLFIYPQQPIHNETLANIANSYNIKENVAQYTKPEVVQQFQKVYQSKVLVGNEIFSVFNNEHLQYAVALFKVLYYAKDYNTFYNTALWARSNVNQGVYLYAVSVALTHRKDTYGLVLPPVYEIYPQYFFDNEVIEQASQYQQAKQFQKQVQQGQQGQQEESYYTIYANYTSQEHNVHPDQSLGYLLEDIGVNAFYYYYSIYYPFWLDSNEFNFKPDKRGELFYYVHQQILARYYLERLANNKGQPEFLNYQVPLKSGYSPNLRYPNGVEFPSRPNNADLSQYPYNAGGKLVLPYSLSALLGDDYERRLRDAADLGFAIDENGERVNLTGVNGRNEFGNLVESNGDSVNRKFYGNYQQAARHLVGYAPQPVNSHRAVPSALEHYETSLRDPAFYQLVRRIVALFQKYAFTQKPYTKEELSFPGVTIENVEFDRLVTYFDQFHTEVTNALFLNPKEAEGHKVVVRVQQQRLNNKPFTYRIKVNSKKAQQASVRVYIAPQYDEYGNELSVADNQLNAVFIDAFVVKLDAGENVISRNSHQLPFYQQDRPSFRELYHRVFKAQSDNSEYKVTPEDYYLFGFPRRHVLPKGSYDGQNVQFYVLVSPYQPYKGVQENKEVPFAPSIGAGNRQIDNYPLGYPFDRFIPNPHVFHLSNAYAYKTKVYHRSHKAVNSPHHQEENQ